ncbi:hypothetical protein ACFPOE_05640 [Caenimonas terrae]|uniref:Fenitrothion hydrolase n=1 Tax=Caenimonas terrae TaxID=696074 RepID=A0ABW0NAJ1_9BURK
MRLRAALAAGLALPLPLWAHGFDERHALPAPLAHFVIGAVLAVALSFLLALLFARRASGTAAAPALHAPPRAELRLPAALAVALRGLGLLVFLVTVAAALAGSADPLMNLAPTLVWIGWWLGLSLLAAFVIDLWPLLDPWATLFDAGQAAARRLGRPQGLAPGWRWPAALGCWPAALLLLAWSWFEVVYPLAAVPRRLGVAALGWSAITLAGMGCFGRAQWRRNGDLFAIYFGLLGRMAPLALDAPHGRIALRAPGAALADGQGAELPAGGPAFVLAMLSTVLFDGLHAGSAWPWFEGLLQRLLHVPAVDGLVAGTLGLLAVWLLFLAAYAITCIATAALASGLPAVAIARSFAPTLVPIAVGYTIAHNFTSLVDQGQALLALASDPFGWGWNLLGTAQLHIRSGLVDAGTTWNVAIAMVVAGHCAGVWLSHRVAQRLRLPLRATLPLVALMLAYTAASLAVIADPIASYSP